MFIGIVPAADVRVDRVERGGFHAHEHLAAGGHRRGQVADDDVFGRAGLFDVGGFHGEILS